MPPAHRRGRLAAKVERRFRQDLDERGAGVEVRQRAAEVSDLLGLEERNRGERQPRAGVCGDGFDCVLGQALSAKVADDLLPILEARRTGLPPLAGAPRLRPFGQCRSVTLV